MEDTLENSIAIDTLTLFSKLTGHDEQEQIINSFVDGMNRLLKSGQLEQAGNNSVTGNNSKVFKINTNRHNYGSIVFQPTNNSYSSADLKTTKAAVKLLAQVLDNKFGNRNNNTKPKSHPNAPDNESVLKNSLRSLANAQKMAHIGNWDYYVQSNELYWSDEIYRIFGLSAQQFGATYEAFLETIHPDDLEFVEKSHHDAIYNHKPYSIDHRIVLPNGEIRHVHQHAEVIFDKDHKPTYFGGTVQDITERKSAELAKQHSEEILRSVTECSPDHIMLLDTKGNILFINRTVPDLTVEKVLNTPIYDYIPEKSRPVVEQCLQRVLNSSKPDIYVVDYENAKGETLLFESNVGPVIQDNIVTAFTVSSRDVTERFEAEQALRRSETNLARAQKIAKLGFWSWDFASDEFNWSNETYNIFGFNKEDYDRLTISALNRSFSAIDQENIKRSKQLAIDKKRLLPTEYQIALPDKSKRHIWVVGNINFDQSGEAIGLFGTVQDITERTQVESVLKALTIGTNFSEINNFYHDCLINLMQLFGVQHAYIGFLDNQSIIRCIATRKYNRKVDNFQYPIAGSPCRLVVEKKIEYVTNRAANSFPNHSLFIDNEITYYYGAPLVAADQRVIGIIALIDSKHISIPPWIRPILGVFATRITVEYERYNGLIELQQQQNQLERLVESRTAELSMANKELEAFSYSVSHDLRSPLRTISGFSQILMEDYKDVLDQGGIDCLQRLRHAGKQMNELIDNLLKLSRVNQINLRPESVDLALIAQDIIETLKFADKQRNVYTTIFPELLVEGDRVLMHSLIQNLIDNAWKYTSKREDAKIEFGQLIRSGKSIFYIRDNGIGFDMKQSCRLFQTFQRLHPATEFEGSGIGLATVQRIIHRHGGNIWADAKPGEGATFYFCFS